MDEWMNGWWMGIGGWMVVRGVNVVIDADCIYERKG